MTGNSLRPDRHEAAAVVLELRDVSANYGKREVLHHVSLTVRQGEIVAVVGPNGAGKSTLFKVIAGLVAPTSGQVLLTGRDIAQMPGHLRARAGIGYVMQGQSVFQSLSPLEHISLAVRTGAERRGRPVPEDLLPAPFVSSDAMSAPAGLLSGGQRQILAIATALATSPVLLLCDEPSAGLGPALALQQLGHIAALTRRDGVAVLWAEQKLREVLSRADRAVLLRAGSIQNETDSPEIWLDPAILSSLMLGRSSALGASHD